MSRPQGHSAIGRILCQWKIPMTPAGIETATFRFVAQHLNNCATAVPLKSGWIRKLTHSMCQRPSWEGDISTASEEISSMLWHPKADYLVQKVPPLVPILRQINSAQDPILLVDKWKTNLMSLAILFHLLCAQHVSDINISIFRSLRLCWWLTTSVVLFSVRCVLEFLVRLVLSGVRFAGFSRTKSPTHNERRTRRPMW